MNVLKNNEEYKMITKTGKELRHNMVFVKNEFSQNYVTNVSSKDGLLLDFLISLIEAPKKSDGSDLVDENGNVRDQYTRYCFKKKSYFECIGNKFSGDNLANFEDSILKINSVAFWHKDTNKTNGHKEGTLVKIIDKCQIDYDTGIIYIKFHESCFKFFFNIKSYLNDIKDKKDLSEENNEDLKIECGNFHAYEIGDEILFKSKYSRPLFNYFLSFKGFRTKTLYVNDLRIICGLKKSQYPLYKTFKHSILLLVLKEINKYTAYNIMILEEIKENQKNPIKIKFLIEQKDAYTYNQRITKNNSIIDGEVVEDNNEEVIVALPEKLNI